ncbi:MAG: hypothetical protein WCP45_12490 [Verrucomicrobiota bacterium]
MKLFFKGLRLDQRPHGGGIEGGGEVGAGGQREIELRAATPHATIHYWRDKSQREIDFIVAHANGAADALEAKINPDALDPAAFKAFRAFHPRGTNYLICPFVRSAMALRLPHSGRSQYQRQNRRKSNP